VNNAAPAWVANLHGEISKFWEAYRKGTPASAELLLDLMDLGFAIKTPLSFLADKDRRRLREILLALPEAEGRALFEAIKKPPLPDQEGIFTRYDIAPKDRKQVWDIARRLLFDRPELALDPRELQEQTEAIVRRQHGG
jgi:hypothetical protein